MSLLLKLAIAPVALLLIYIYKKDVISKEPTKALVKAFIGGCLVVLLDLLVLLPGMLLLGEASEWSPLLLSVFGQSFIEAGIPEELCKFAVLYFLAWKSKDFDEHFDGIVYAVFVSMGFACLENIMYVVMGGVGTGILRAITAVPGHFFFGVIMGYYFSRAKFVPKMRKNAMLKALFIPMLLHGTYDFILFLITALANVEEEDMGPTAVIIIVFVIFFFVFNFFLWKQGRKRIEELRADDLAVQQGIMPAPVNDSIETNDIEKDNMLVK